MSLADGRPVRHDRQTGERCQKIVHWEGQGWRSDEICNPVCDVVKLE